MDDDDRYIINSVLSHFKDDMKEIIGAIKDTQFEEQYNELWMLLQPQEHEKIHEYTTRILLTVANKLKDIVPKWLEKYIPIINPKIASYEMDDEIHKQLAIKLSPIIGSLCCVDFLYKRSEVPTNVTFDTLIEELSGELDLREIQNVVTPMINKLCLTPEMSSILVNYFCPVSLQEYELPTLFYGNSGDGDIKSYIKSTGIFPLQILAECSEDSWSALICVIIFLHSGLSPDMIDRNGGTALQISATHNGPLFNYLIHYVIDKQNSSDSMLGLTPISTPSHRSRKMKMTNNTAVSRFKMEMREPSPLVKNEYKDESPKIPPRRPNVKTIDDLTKEIESLRTTMKDMEEMFMTSIKMIGEKVGLSQQDLHLVPSIPPLRMLKQDSEKKSEKKLFQKIEWF